MPQCTIQARWDNMQHYLQALSQYKHNLITWQLDPRLFSLDNETVGQCLTEALQTFDRLQNMTEIAQVEFYAEKLVAQYHALLEFTRPINTTKPHFTLPNVAAKHQNKQQIHQLPPKVRLEKYYQFLRRFNDMIAQQNDELLHTEPQQQAVILAKIQQIELRKQRCQDAIDNLEGYLMFAAERESYDGKN